MVITFENTPEFLSDHAILIHFHTGSSPGLHSFISALVEYCHPEDYLRGRGLKVQSDNKDT